MAGRWDLNGGTVGQWDCGTGTLWDEDPLCRTKKNVRQLPHYPHNLPPNPYL